MPACSCARACRRRRIAEWPVMEGGEVHTEILDTAGDGNVALCANFHRGTSMDVIGYQAWHRGSLR